MQNSQKETGVNYQFSAKYLVIPTYKKSFLCIKNILQKRYFTWSLLKKSVFYQRFQNILSFETSLKNQRDVCLKPFFSIWVPGAFLSFPITSFTTSSLHSSRLATSDNIIERTGAERCQAQPNPIDPLKVKNIEMFYGDFSFFST